MFILALNHFNLSFRVYNSIIMIIITRENVHLYLYVPTVVIIKIWISNLCPNIKSTILQVQLWRLFSLIIFKLICLHVQAPCSLVHQIEPPSKVDQKKQNSNDWTKSPQEGKMLSRAFELDMVWDILWEQVPFFDKVEHIGVVLPIFTFYFHPRVKVIEIVNFLACSIIFTWGGIHFLIRHSNLLV